MDLLERESQLKALDGALSDAANGRGRVVLVSGEAGIGKTSLVRTFLQSIDTEGPRTPRILRGACENLSVAEPLAPLYDLARAYDVTVGAIQQTNGLGRRTTIRIGQELTIPLRSPNLA